jgi:hypothetical protein
VLQDLTFVHIGNNDLLPDGSINFSKRWQQFNIVENMKRFKKGQVPHYSGVRTQLCRWGPLFCMWTQVEGDRFNLGNACYHSVQKLLSLRI